MTSNLRKATLRSATLAIVLSLAGGAVAADNAQDQATRLAVARDRAENGALSVKPSQAMRLRQQAEDLQKLIDAAQSGKKLDPAQVDDAIRRSYQGF